MRRCAFTLIEVLAAIALLLILSSSLMSFGAVLIDRADWTDRTAQDLRACGLVFDRVSTALRTCEVGGGSLGSGVEGDATSMTVLCRVDAQGDSGLARMHLSFDRARGALVFAFGDATDSGVEETLTERVAAVRIRYSDGSAWQESFDSAASDALPRAIEVSIWLGTPPTRAEGTSEDGTPSRSADRVRVFAVPDAGAQEASS
ncbi:MAG: prepilin-type N-terminal cleavage/methylation domain-containing protein [Phycisphaerales bacterium]